MARRGRGYPLSDLQDLGCECGKREYPCPAVWHLIIFDTLMDLKKKGIFVLEAK